MPQTDIPESTPDLDDALNELRQRMADTGIVAGIVTDLRRNSDRLKPMLADELRKLRTLLDEILPLLSVLALLILPLAGCAVDLGKLAADMKRPAVTFESPESWSCDQSMKIPTGSAGVVEDCSVCRNRVSMPQRVTIKNAPLDVPAGGSVLLCPTSAKVMAEPSRKP
jgi:hypothetical protein